jgi:predicted MPP superfamily phosphohydrolase
VIQITRHRVKVPNLPAELRGLRIVQLSDLHRSKYTQDRRLRHAVAQANAACPDLILLTGDFVTADPADIEPCSHILSPLHAPLGRYAVLGNHDFTAGAQAVECMLTRLGIHVLTNESVRLENGLRLVGLEDDRHGKPDPVRAFREVRPDEPTLVLSHNPVGAELISQHDCIVFSGHTHGGQIRLPLLTEREVRKIGSKHYREGWFTVGKARLYVNRGLGQVGLPVRFLCRPEMSIFTLE